MRARACSCVDVSCVRGALSLGDALTVLEAATAESGAASVAGSSTMDDEAGEGSSAFGGRCGATCFRPMETPIGLNVFLWRVFLALALTSSVFAVCLRRVPVRYGNSLAFTGERAAAVAHAKICDAADALSMPQVCAWGDTIGKAQQTESALIAVAT